MNTFITQAKERIVRLAARWFAPWIENRQLREEYEELRAITEMLQARIPRNVRGAMKQLLPESLEWYDYTELSENDRVKYQKYAAALLENPVFINETKFITHNFLKKAFWESQNYEDVERMRFYALALQDFAERVAEIPLPPEAEARKPENPYEGI